MAVKRALFLCLFLVVACQPSGKQAHPRSLIPIDPSATGTIHGVVVFKGQPPAPNRIPVSSFPGCSDDRTEDEDVLIRHGRVQNAFVTIPAGLDRYAFPPPTQEVVLDQHGCLYEPRVVGLRVGQTLVIRNSDQALHNVHALPKFSHSFNVAMGKGAAEIRKTFDQPEIMVPIRCDVHPWMRAYVGVSAHPIFAVTGTDGTFDLRGIPAGTYTLVVWHERLGRVHVPVTVKAGAIVEKTIALVP